ncbi:MAG: LysR family transcriptional regulator [Boseongicola sp.]|nr:LysR family transcriptional regulator [Boseongicola sp.]
MIDDYKGLAVFVAVAEAGSFSQAGRQLKLSTSVVSHHVNKIEEKLGVSLFFRSTRSLSLTQEGQKVLSASKRMVAAGEEALDALTELSDQPVGTLRVAMPGFGENSSIYRAVWEFANKHPLVSISLHGSDHTVDLVKEGFDVAIRLGRLKDSALKTRRVGDFQRMLVAAPSYLDQLSPIRTLDDLQQCQFVSMTMLADSFKLEKDGEVVEFVPENLSIEVNSVTIAKSAVKAGLCVRQLPVSEIEEELANGSLVRVLPEWSLADLGIYAVWPETGPQKHLTRRFIDHLASTNFCES